MSQRNPFTSRAHSVHELIINAIVSGDGASLNNILDKAKAEELDNINLLARAAIRRVMQLKERTQNPIESHAFINCLLDLYIKQDGTLRITAFDEDTFNIISDLQPESQRKIFKILVQHGLLFTHIKITSREKLEAIVFSATLDDLNLQHAESGMTALHFAHLHRNINLIRILIDFVNDVLDKQGKLAQVYAPDLHAEIKKDKKREEFSSNLLQAIKDNDVIMAAHCIVNLASVEVPLSRPLSIDSDNAVIMAFQFRRFDIGKLLFARMRTTEFRLKCLHIFVLEYLHLQKANPNDPQNEDCIAWMKAMIFIDYEKDCKILVDSVIGPATLHELDKIGKPELINKLVKAKTKTGDTLLHYFSSIDVPNEVQRLIELGSDVNANTTEETTPLIVAIAKKQTEIAALLLENNADANHLLIPDENGRAVHLAVVENNAKILESLIKFNANVDEVSKDGTPLTMSVVKDYWACFETLINGSNCDVNVRDHKGRSALRQAIVCNREKMVKILLADKKTDFSTPSHDNKTPLQLAILRANPTIVMSLLKAGAGTEAAFGDHSRPLIIAINAAKTANPTLQSTYIAIAKLLIDYGADYLSVDPHEEISPFNAAKSSPALSALVTYMEQKQARNQPKKIDKPSAKHDAELANAITKKNATKVFLLITENNCKLDDELILKLKTLDGFTTLTKLLHHEVKKTPTDVQLIFKLFECKIKSFTAQENRLAYISHIVSHLNEPIFTKLNKNSTFKTLCIGLLDPLIADDDLCDAILARPDLHSKLKSLNYDAKFIDKLTIREFAKTPSAPISTVVTMDNKTTHHDENDAPPKKINNKNRNKRKITVVYASQDNAKPVTTFTSEEETQLLERANKVSEKLPQARERSTANPVTLQDRQSPLIIHSVWHQQKFAHRFLSKSSRKKHKVIFLINNLLKTYSYENDFFLNNETSFKDLMQLHCNIDGLIALSPSHELVTRYQKIVGIFSDIQQLIHVKENSLKTALAIEQHFLQYLLEIQSLECYLTSSTLYIDQENKAEESTNKNNEPAIPTAKSETYSPISPPTAITSTTEYRFTLVTNEQYPQGLVAVIPNKIKETLDSLPPVLSNIFIVGKAARDLFKESWFDYDKKKLSAVSTDYDLSVECSDVSALLKDGFYQLPGAGNENRYRKLLPRLSIDISIRKPSQKMCDDYRERDFTHNVYLNYPDGYFYSADPRSVSDLLTNKVRLINPLSDPVVALRLIKSSMNKNAELPPGEIAQLQNYKPPKPFNCDAVNGYAKKIFLTPKIPFIIKSHFAGLLIQYYLLESLFAIKSTNPDEATKLLIGKLNNKTHVYFYGMFVPTINSQIDSCIDVLLKIYDSEMSILSKITSIINDLPQKSGFFTQLRDANLADKTLHTLLDSINAKTNYLQTFIASKSSLTYVTRLSFVALVSDLNLVKMHIAGIENKKMHATNAKIQLAKSVVLK